MNENVYMYNIHKALHVVGLELRLFSFNKISCVLDAYFMYKMEKGVGGIVVLLLSLFLINM